MKMSAPIARTLGLLLATVGSFVWTRPVEFDPESVLARRLPGQIKVIDGQVVSNLSEACSSIVRDSHWVLFVMDANFVSDNRFRTYFETAEEPTGLWVEYDSGLVRLGLGLGRESLVSNLDIPIRIVRRNERATVLIGVTSNQTRVVTHVLDRKRSWPGSFLPNWRCDSVQVGSEQRELSTGNSCDKCEVTLRFATGDDSQKLQQILGEISNYRQFNLRRWCGTAVSLFGILLLFVPLRVFSICSTRLRLSRKIFKDGVKRSVKK